MGLGGDAPLDVSYLRLDINDSGVPAVVAHQKVGFPLQGVCQFALQCRHGCLIRRTQAKQCGIDDTLGVLPVLGTIVTLSLGSSPLDVSAPTLRHGSVAPVVVSYLRLDSDDSGVLAVIAPQKVGLAAAWPFHETVAPPARAALARGAGNWGRLLHRVGPLFDRNSLRNYPLREDTSRPRV